MKKQLSIREWQTLSAYLDGNISPHEKSHLESKLSSDAELREALEELRRTRTILRNTPAIKAPRNFTLTRQMVGIKETKKATAFFPLFKFSTVIASILFVFALLGDFFVRPVQQMAVPQEQEMVYSEEYLEKPAAEQADRVVPTATWAAPKEVTATEEAEEKSADVLSNAPIEPLPSTMPSIMQIEPTQNAAELPMLAVGPETTPLPTEEAIAPIAKERGILSSGMEEGAPVTEAAEQVTEQVAIAEDSGEVSTDNYGMSALEVTPQKELNIWRIFEIVFGGLIIIFGVLAIFFKPKESL